MVEKCVTRLIPNDFRNLKHMVEKCISSLISEWFSKSEAHGGDTTVSMDFRNPKHMSGYFVSIDRPRLSKSDTHGGEMCVVCCFQ